MAKSDEVWARERVSRAVSFLQGGNLRRAREMSDRILKRVPDHVDGLRLAGDIARRQRRFDAALNYYVAAAKNDPAHAPTLDLIGVIAAKIDQYDLAIEAYEYSVVRDPQDASRHLRLATAYFGAGRLEEALGHAKLAGMLLPSSAASASLIGVIQNHLDDNEAAIDAFDRALSLAPDDARTMVNAALAFEAVGDSDRATELRRRAAAAAPDDPLVAFMAKDLERFATRDARFDRLVEVADDTQRAGEHRVLAHLALAKMNDDVGDVAIAAGHAQEGNRLRQEQLERRGQHYRADVEEARRSAVFAELPSIVGSGAVRDAPRRPRAIALVGLPRSGKSLLEARIADHPDVLALGETDGLSKVVESYREMTGQPFPGGLSELPSDVRTELHGVLLDQLCLSDHASAPEAYTMTSPGLMPLVGLLATIDPDVRVVHCRRDPRDLLLANYLQWFPNNQPFAWTIAGLVHHYRLYESYASQWGQLLGSRLVEVAYEELVTTPSTTVARVCELVGIAPTPDQRHLEVLHDVEVAASPTAKLDPRAPLHGAHVGGWRRWAEHLPELFDAIDQAGLCSGWGDGG